MSTSRSERTVGPAGLLALAAVLVHVACFDPYSNQLFEAFIAQALAKSLVGASIVAYPATNNGYGRQACGT